MILFSFIYYFNLKKYFQVSSINRVLRNLAAQKEQQHSITTTVVSPGENSTTSSSASVNDLQTTPSLISADTAPPRGSNNPVLISTDITLDISCAISDSSMDEKLRLLNGHSEHHHHQQFQNHQNIPTPRHHPAWSPLQYSSTTPSWYSSTLNNTSSITTNNASNTQGSSGFHNQRQSTSVGQFRNSSCSGEGNGLKKGII